MMPSMVIHGDPWVLTAHGTWQPVTHSDTTQNVRQQSHRSRRRTGASKALPQTNKAEQWPTWPMTQPGIHFFNKMRAIKSFKWKDPIFSRVTQQRASKIHRGCQWGRCANDSHLSKFRKGESDRIEHWSSPRPACKIRTQHSNGFRFVDPKIS